MEERRLLLALALSILVMTAWGYLFAPKPAPPKLPLAPSAAPSAAGTPSAPTAGTTPKPAPTATSSPAAPTVADERERRVEIDSQAATLAFTNRGAQLLSWQLKRFKDTRGRGEEMVPAGRSGPRPLDLETGDAELDGRLREALFQPSGDEVHVPEGGEGELRFVFSDGEIQAEKVLHVRRGGELVEVKAEVRRRGEALPVKVLWGPGLGNPTAAEIAVQGYLPPQGIVRTARGVERLPAASLREPRRFSGIRFVGLESHYFVALFVSEPEGSGELRTVTKPAEEGATEASALAAADVAAGPVLLYVGAKDYHTLKTLGHGLADVVPVGEWIGPIVVPLMSLLRFVHGVVGNYGWSIVALTVLINLLMAPLRHYSIANGMKMAKVAPEIRVIQERYRKVPLMERGPMNDEIAKVYSRHGMSMSTQMTVGCLPLLLTMPFLIAFYRVLQVSIELKGASFMWIPDLSQRDPLFITPILMGASMLLMQKLTPTGTMDPAQARMMMLMPVVLTVMFVAAPAGLNLYWLASNVCSIVQQTLTMRLLRGQGEPALAREKNERKKK